LAKTAVEKGTLFEWFRFNEMTHRVEVGLKRKVASQLFNESWKLEQTDEPNFKKAKLAKPNKQVKPVKQVGDAEPSWKETWKVKTRVNSAVQVVSGLRKRVVENPAELSWVQGVPEYKAMSEALQAWEQLGKDFSFWFNLCVASTLQEARRMYPDDATMQIEFRARSPQVVALTTQMNASSAVLKDILAVRK